MYTDKTVYMLRECIYDYSQAAIDNRNLYEENTYLKRLLTDNGISFCSLFDDNSGTVCIEPEELLNIEQDIIQRKRLSDWFSLDSTKELLASNGISEDDVNYFITLLSNRT